MEHQAEKARRRYPVALDAQYKIRCHGVAIVGTGRTAWMSGEELAFIANGELPKCEPIEVSLRWPAELPGGISLKLVIRGRVCETDGNRIKVAITNYEFHTRAVFPKTHAETRPGSSDAYGP